MIAHAGVDHVAIGVVAAAVVGVHGIAWLHGSRPSRGALWCWIGGVVGVVVASSPWVERLAERTFTGHMVQHLIVILVAAPLLVLGRPVHTLMAAGWIPTTALGRRLGGTWHRTGPILGPGLFVLVLFVTHLTAIYDDALGNRWLHELEHAAYLLSATAMWAAVLGVGRAAAPARIAGVFGVIVGGSFLGMILLAATAPLMPTYEARLGTARALDDQRAAAALMWVTGMVTTLPLLLLAVWRWAATEERIARRAEALSDGVVTGPR
ncbi:MAG: cytochrome c oxidase assembly protein [Ilumatobacteraceae bacterium]